jgi:hypothetical protein
MLDETQEASQENTESEITDEMLDRAADSVDEETTEEVIGEEEGTETDGEAAEEVDEEASEAAEDVAEEPEDNAERSRLGRKVKELEDKLSGTAQTSTQVASALEKLNAFLGKQEEPEEPEFFEMPETTQELNALLDKRLEERERAKTIQGTKQAEEYQSGYVDTVMDLLEGDSEEEKSTILELIQGEFNVKHSEVDSIQTGIKDAAKNVMAARKKMLQSGVKSLPLGGKKPIAPLGGGGGDKIPAKSKKLIKLDPEAAQVQKDLGLTDEYMQEALG